jgi:hypothetical protein
MRLRKRSAFGSATQTSGAGLTRPLKACCTPLITTTKEARCEAPTRRHVVESSRDPRKVSSTSAAGASLATYSLYFYLMRGG